MSDKKLRLTLPDSTLPLPKLSKPWLKIGRKPKKRGKNKGNYNKMMNQIRRGMR